MTVTTVPLYVRASGSTERLFPYLFCKSLMIACSTLGSTWTFKRTQMNWLACIAAVLPVSPVSTSRSRRFRGLRAVDTLVGEIRLLGRNSTVEPPAKSIPTLRWKNMSDIVPGTMTASDISKNR